MKAAFLNTAVNTTPLTSGIVCVSEMISQNLRENDISALALRLKGQVQ